MKFCSLVCAAALMAPISSVAQSAVATTPSPAASTQPASPGPSMEETVGFIHDMYARQGKLDTYKSIYLNGWSENVSIEQPEACRLQVAFDTVTDFKPYNGDGGIHLRDQRLRILLALDTSDPLSVSVYENKSDDVTPTPSFSVRVKRAIGTQYEVPIHYREDGPVLDVPKGDAFTLQGKVLSVTPTEVTFGAQDRNRYRLPLHLDKATVTRNGQPADLSGAQVGDLLKYDVTVSGSMGVFKANIKHFTTVTFGPVYQEPMTQQYKESALPPLPDEETANRIAKALIHAMVLCHKDEKPSPF